MYLAMVESLSSDATPCAPRPSLLAASPIVSRRTRIAVNDNSDIVQREVKESSGKLNHDEDPNIAHLRDWLSKRRAMRHGHRTSLVEFASSQLHASVQSTSSPRSAPAVSSSYSGRRASSVKTYGAEASTSLLERPVSVDVNWIGKDRDSSGIGAGVHLLVEQHVPKSMFPELDAGSSLSGVDMGVSSGGSDDYVDDAMPTRPIMIPHSPAKRHNEGVLSESGTSADGLVVLPGLHSGSWEASPNVEPSLRDGDEQGPDSHLATADSGSMNVDSNSPPDVGLALSPVAPGAAMGSACSRSLRRWLHSRLAEDARSQALTGRSRHMGTPHGRDVADDYQGMFSPLMNGSLGVLASVPLVPPRSLYQEYLNDTAHLDAKHAKKLKAEADEAERLEKERRAAEIVLRRIREKKEEEERQKDAERLAREKADRERIAAFAGADKISMAALLSTVIDEDVDEDNNDDDEDDRFAGDGSDKGGSDKEDETKAAGGSNNNNGNIGDPEATAKALQRMQNGVDGFLLTKHTAPTRVPGDGKKKLEVSARSRQTIFRRFQNGSYELKYELEEKEREARDLLSARLAEKQKMQQLKKREQGWK